VDSININALCCVFNLRLWYATTYIPSIENMFFLQLSLTVGDKVYSFLTGDETGSQEVDAMVLALATAIRSIFPTVPLQ
jgi:hypothetical protein